MNFLSTHNISCVLEIPWRICSLSPYRLTCVSKKHVFALMMMYEKSLSGCYRIYPKYWDTLMPYHTGPKTWTRGPQATARSPEWHSHCKHADVMQYFSNPIITTNEKNIIWAVLSFEEEYMGLTVNGAWSFELTINHISKVGSMWNLVEIG